MSQDTEVIICYCLKCGLKLGSFDNSWEGLGKTYYIPKVIRDVAGFRAVGAIKPAVGPAQVGTTIENRYVLSNFKSCIRYSFTLVLFKIWHVPNVVKYLDCDVIVHQKVTC